MPAPLITRQTIKARRPLKFLLAEDNAVNMKLAVHLLSKRGHQVVTAENGRQAFERYKVERFDAVLMDVQMPEMDGLETTTAIRQLEKASNRRVPIIAMTAHAMVGDRERCLSAGMDAYVAKPLKTADLFAAIDGLIDSAAASEGDRSAGSPAAETHPPVNLTRLTEQTGGDDDLIRELIGIFRADWPGQFAAIRSAAAAGNAGGLALAAHKLKGSVGTFGADAAVEAAVALELPARSGDLSSAPERLDRLEAELHRVDAALSGRLAKPAPAAKVEN
jgi:CheY-like chemotaxis protein